MKRYIPLALALLALLASSCTERKVKQFTQEFAAAVTRGDSATIAAMYPDARLAEKLEMPPATDQLTIEEKADTLVVRLAGDRSLAVVKTTDSQLRIADSHGLFVYPAARLEFARNTGWVKDGMSDLQMARQFADTAFVAYLAKKYVAQMKTQLSVKNYTFKGGGEGMSWETCYSDYYAIVVNNSASEIKGSDYEVCSNESATGRYQKPQPGKDIQPGQSHPFLVRVSCAAGASPEAYVRFVISDTDLLAKYFTPKGGEYDDYLRSPLSRHNKQ